MMKSQPCTWYHIQMIMGPLMTLVGIYLMMQRSLFWLSKQLLSPCWMKLVLVLLLKWENSHCKGPEVSLVSRSSSIWESCFPFNGLRIYVCLYWSWELVVFFLSCTYGDTYKRLVYTWYKYIFRIIAVLIVFFAVNEKRNLMKTISKRENYNT